MSNIVIQTTGLTRSYKSYEKEAGIKGSLKGFWNRQYTEKIALAPTDLQIAGGQIIGLVGANGAGKTTLLKILSGLIHPTGGTAQVLGYTPWQRKNDFLRQMSIMLGQKNQLWWDISALDSYALLAEIYDLDRTQAMQKVTELAELLDCTHVLKTQLRRLSLGERMKMEIIGALLHSPKVLYLDEPTIGLDVVAQTTIRNFIGKYVKEMGTTVILTSHYMDDIAKLADRLLLISKGQIVYDGTVPGFMQKSESKQRIVFSTSEPLIETLKILDHSFEKGQQEFQLQVSEKELAQALSKITAIPGVHSLKIEEADFEEIIHTFLQKESRLFQTRNRH